MPGIDVFEFVELKTWDSPDEPGHDANQNLRAA
jgi:hypothetical protein